MNSQKNNPAVTQNLAAAFDAAVNAEYPVPDNPHASVVQRAVDNRAAMWRGITAAQQILMEHQGFPTAAAAATENAPRDLSASALLKLWEQAQEMATDTMPAPFLFAKLLFGNPVSPAVPKALTPHTADIEQMLDEAEQAAAEDITGNKLASFPLEEMAWDDKHDLYKVCRFNDWQLTLGDIRAAKKLAKAKPVMLSSVPTGYKLVPVEPTPEMIAALAFSGDTAMVIGHAAIAMEVAENYKACIAAAPESPVDEDAYYSALKASLDACLKLESELGPRKENEFAVAFLRQGVQRCIGAITKLIAQGPIKKVPSIDTPEFRALTLALIESANSTSEVSDAAHEALVAYVDKVKLAPSSQAAVQSALKEAARIARKYVGCDHIATQILAIGNGNTRISPEKE